MASIEHPERTAQPARRVAWLLAGDVLAFHVVTAIGLLSHSELDGLGALPHLLEVALPFAGGWLIVSPFMGAFSPAVARHPGRMLLRTALAWLIACPLSLLFWSLVRQRPVQTPFAIVTFVTNMIMLLLWRGAYAWRASRRDALAL